MRQPDSIMPSGSQVMVNNATKSIVVALVMFCKVSILFKTGHAVHLAENPCSLGLVLAQVVAHGMLVSSISFVYPFLWLSGCVLVSHEDASLI